MEPIGQKSATPTLGDRAAPLVGSRKAALSAVLLGVGWLAAAVVLPMLIHPLGLGRTLLPMHLPVLLAGATLGPLAGMSVGALAPWLSFLLTGMPPVTPPTAPLMVVELMVYGGIAGAVRRHLPLARRGFLGSYLWLVPSLIGGRLALAAAAWLIGPPLGLAVAPATYVQSALVAGIPGIVVQLVAIPVLLPLMGRRAGLDRVAGGDGAIR